MIERIARKVERKRRTPSEWQALIVDWHQSGLSQKVFCDQIRHQQRATLVISQLLIDTWHEYLNEPTVADAILDRLVHNAYKINLDGESMRKQHAPALT